VIVLSSGNHRSDLRADFEYGAVYDFLGSGGTIAVMGWIYNDGDAYASGTVHFRIFDGYSWHDRNVPTGGVQAGGQIAFAWYEHFDQMDPDRVQVRWTLTA